MPAPDTRDGFDASVVRGTQEHWEARTGECVSAEDAAESIRNVSEFFRLLVRWDAADQQQGTGDETTPDESAREGIR